jgi:hypothetical protein
MNDRPVWLRFASPIVLGAVCHLVAPAAASAQPKSTTTLIQRGSDLFDDQQYEESIQALSAALMRPGTTKQEKIETYRLLAYNYIILKRTEEADAAVRGLLVLDESFRLAPTESPRFRDFFDATRQKWEAEGKPGVIEEGKPVEVVTPISMQHSSPAQVPPNTPIKLTGTVTDPAVKVRGVQLAYRTGAKGKFVTIPASFSMGRFSGQIPASAVKPPLVEYYIQAVDKAGLPLASRGDFATPLRIAVPAPEEGSIFTSPWFWIPVGLAVAAAVVVPVVLVTTQSSSTPTSSVTVNVGE